MAREFIENSKTENYNKKSVSIKDETFYDKVSNICNDITEMLVSKNQKYGDAALNPKRIFSKVDSVEQLKVRIDDKLSRISNQNIEDDEDVVNDLIGYLILLKIALNDKTDRS